MPLRAAVTCPVPTIERTRAHPACALLLAVALAGCGKPSMPPSTAPQPPAELRTGEVTVRATTLPTLRLNDAMAHEYGVERDAGSVLLVVGLRRGTQAQETSVSGRVSARASDLLGNRQEIALRRIEGAGYIDYVGVARVSAPDTLRFEIDVRPDGAPAATLRFHRDFFPESPL